MTNKVVIMVTAGSRRESRKIARRLVDGKLAACANITSNILSVYRWEGKLVEDKEYLIFLKSTRELFPEIKAEISKIHSYQVPEIICLPIIDGSQNYLEWLAASVKPTSASI